MSKVLFENGQTTPTFYASSDEGDLVFVDWSIKPPATAADAEKAVAEHVRTQYESERNNRHIVALERSPFYDDLLLTVHDFNFCIWKTSLEE